MPPHSGPHPKFNRRLALQAGAIGIMGLGTNHLTALRAAGGVKQPRARSVIFVFLSGGLGQLDSFDMKPDAPTDIRGEFKPISTTVPGLSICEHLPKLAARAHLWSLVRSLSHSSNDHSAGHHIMLTGRRQLPIGFNPNSPKPTDEPSIAAVAGAVVKSRNNLPPAIVLPERLVHTTGRVLPGQFAGLMGEKHDPWFVEASPFDPLGYGAYPTYEFDHQDRPHKARRVSFEAPSLALPEGFGSDRLGKRIRLLQSIEEQRRQLDTGAAYSQLDDHRQGAISLLTNPSVRRAIEVEKAEPSTLDRYGRHSFGWSLLMARRLVESGVCLVQVNLGNNETWDTHGNAFPHLKDHLYPPTDQALSALIDDLANSGMLESTMIVVAGEFGRTPRISRLPQFYKQAGRDHWGAVQTVLLAGGGIAGGRVIGSTDKIGGFPITDIQHPENLAATIYQGLGIPSEATWQDDLERPHFVYHDAPIRGLL
jgi:hypothetical protein